MLKVGDQVIFCRAAYLRNEALPPDYKFTNATIKGIIAWIQPGIIKVQYTDGSAGLYYHDHPDKENELIKC